MQKGRGLYWETCLRTRYCTNFDYRKSTETPWVNFSSASKHGKRLSLITIVLRLYSTFSLLNLESRMRYHTPLLQIRPAPPLFPSITVLCVTTSLPKILPTMPELSNITEYWDIKKCPPYLTLELYTWNFRWKKERILLTDCWRDFETRKTFSLKRLVLEMMYFYRLDVASCNPGATWE